MNNSIIADYYEPLLTDNHFIPVDSNNRFNSAGQCWRLSPEFGEGLYWVYAKKDLYDIKIHDFYFHEDFFMEFNLPEALSITQYESISGEELNPYRRMSAGCIKAFIGGYKPYKALIHKKIPIRSIGIEVMRHTMRIISKSNIQGIISARLQLSGRSIRQQISQLWLNCSMK